MNRREVKEMHEQAVINAFKQYCENNGKTFEVLEKPEPPDALVLIDGKKIWVEITDAFLNREFAESITSYAAEDKDHRPVAKEQRFIIESNQTFRASLVECILKKYTKDSIGKVFEQYGSGILIVGINTPFSNAENSAVKEKDTVLETIKPCEQRFNTIYFYDPYTQDISQVFNKKIDT